MSVDWTSLRADFLNAKQYTYLDHAAGGPLARPVQEAVEKYHRELAEEADFAWPKWMKRREEVRRKAARFINARPEEITFITSTSHGMNLIAELLASEGKVLTNREEFPSSLLPWLWRKAEMVYQSSSPQEVSLSALKEKLTPDVKTILTSYVQYGSGYRQEMKALGALKGDRYLVVNATQGFGVLPIDVQAWQADFLCSNSYKWMMAGYGGGILFIKEKWLSHFKPHAVGWRSMVNPDEIDNQKMDLLPTAERYEMGCPNFGPIFALGAAIDYVSAIGIEAIEKRVLSLTRMAVDLLRGKGFEILSSLERDHRSGILIVKVKDTSVVWKRLLQEKIFVTPRGGGLRLAPHFYNTPEEIEGFVDALVKCRGN